MSAIELIDNAEIIMVKIGVITGWIMPINAMQTVLIDQLAKTLVESYPTVNKEEVEYAFRNRDFEIKDWGKNFNLSLFGQIMENYVANRYEISKIEQHIKIKSLQIEEKREITDTEMVEWVDEWKEKIKVTPNPMIIPPLFYDWLTKKKLIVLTKEQKLDYLKNQAVTYRHFYLSDQSVTNGEHSQERRDLNAFNVMVNEGCFTGIEVSRLKELAKKIAVFDYLKSFNVSN